jgi:hypothetical protein
MTELIDLLDSVAREPGAPHPEVVAEDLRRGRRALMRRRRAAASAVALMGAAATAAAFALIPQIGGDNDVRMVAPAVGPVASDPPNPGVDLVAYDGPLHGAKLDPAEIPDGWSVSGDAYHLLISPPGSSSSDDTFLGKILVSVDKGIPDEPLPKDEGRVAVGDVTGYVITADPSAMQVWVPLPNGTALRTQAPPSLGWDASTLGRFLGGVSVLPGAKGTTG